ncbi:MAG: peptidoglycan editing factor PgeF [Porphyromonadaceae bacterium]|nr:peptidoglycan editing factor PgeF [Porphyromonadaceae bacterium]
MIRNSTKVELTHYPILSQFTGISHFSTTRFGGVSSGNYESLNLGLYSGDSNKNINENFERLCSEINVRREQIYLPFQSHENRVLCIDEDFSKETKEAQDKLLNGVDALITRLPEKLIGVTTADCVPILVYDPVTKSVGAAHAGWRGTRGRIAEKMVAAMAAKFGTNPKNIFAAIGVSISPDAYNVGKELIALFEEENFDTEKIFFKKNAKYHLDLQNANKLILENAGIPTENIQNSGICTFNENEKYFSARRLGINSGRLIHCVMLK